MKSSLFKKLQGYWHGLGPGLVTGASDDDPSGIATYSQAGAQQGFGFLWLATLTFPLMAVVQEMCARIGLVTGRGLAANIRLQYPRWVLYGCAGLLFFSNTFNIGADLGAMAQSAQLLAPWAPFALLLVGFTVASLLLQVFTTYAQYARYLKWLALFLLLYIFSTFSIPHMNWREISWHALIPTLSFSKSQLILLCAILGTTISPYLFFWQTSQEVEEEILSGKKTVKARQHDVTPSALRLMRLDVWAGMFLSNLVMFFVIVTCAVTLNQHGITTISTAAQAAAALRPFAGKAAYLFFALNIISTGLLAIPVLAGSTSYALSESFKWREGLYRRLPEAYAFYGIIALSMVLGLVMNFIGLDPIKALVYSAVLNGIISAPLLLLVVLLSSNHKLMGAHRNGVVRKIVGWALVIIMAAASAATIFSLI